MTIVGIESSCDDFGISIIKDGKVLCNEISSQIKDHHEYGGVVPELASRLHLENFDIVFKNAIKKSKINMKEIDAIGYTNNPGLIGSLIIGRLFAKTLSQYLQKPCYPLNHLQGHIASAFIDEEIKFPLVSLIVSGGHTQIVYLNSFRKYKIIGESVDDAIGECFDKVARKIGFGYPGGKDINDCANKANKSLFNFPNVNLEEYNFSFSGIKTKALNFINNENNRVMANKNEFCRDLTICCVKQIMSKLEKSIVDLKPKSISLAGGVSANTFIRDEIIKLGKKYDIKTYIPKFEYCTDNGAMIAKLLDLQLCEK